MVYPIQLIIVKLPSPNYFDKINGQLVSHQNITLETVQQTVPSSLIESKYQQQFSLNPAENDTVIPLDAINQIVQHLTNRKYYNLPQSDKFKFPYLSNFRSDIESILLCHQQNFVLIGGNNSNTTYKFYCSLHEPKKKKALGSSNNEMEQSQKDKKSQYKSAGASFKCQAYLEFKKNN